MNRLIPILVILLMIAFLGILFLLAEVKGPRANIPEPPMKMLSYSSEAARTMAKIEWDGHLWVILNNESICHHPDCPCLKTEIEEVK